MGKGPLALNVLQLNRISEYLSSVSLPELWAGKVLEAAQLAMDKLQSPCSRASQLKVPGPTGGQSGLLLSGLKGR